MARLPKGNPLMLLLRACPRCHGDMVLEEDRRCRYFECIQCAHVLTVSQEKALGVREEVRQHARSQHLAQRAEVRVYEGATLSSAHA
jgi:Zn ribbon nucleic-acid-binding protein